MLFYCYITILLCYVQILFSLETLETWLSAPSLEPRTIPSINICSKDEHIHVTLQGRCTYTPTSLCKQFHFWHSCQQPIVEYVNIFWSNPYGQHHCHLICISVITNEPDCRQVLICRHVLFIRAKAPLMVSWVTDGGLGCTLQFACW